MKPSRWALLALTLFLAGCGLSAQQQADLGVVQQSGVSPAIYDKMVHGDDLSLSDICALERAHVNEGVILRYVRDRGTVYVLSTNDVDRLQSAGASQSLTDYMLATTTTHATSYPAVSVVTYGPPAAYYGPSVTSYWGPAYSDPF